MAAAKALRDAQGLIGLESINTESEPGYGPAFHREIG